MSNMNMNKYILESDRVPIPCEAVTLLCNITLGNTIKLARSLVVSGPLHVLFKNHLVLKIA